MFFAGGRNLLASCCPQKQQPEQSKQREESLPFQWNLVDHLPLPLVSGAHEMPTAGQLQLIPHSMTLSLSGDLCLPQAPEASPSQYDSHTRVEISLLSLRLMVYQFIDQSTCKGISLYHSSIKQTAQQATIYNHTTYRNSLKTITSILKM